MNARDEQGMIMRLCPLHNARDVAAVIIDHGSHVLCTRNESTSDDMADITLRDLLHWERGLSYRAPKEDPDDVGLDRVISWAVMIRAASPILPALRGGEIVIAPPRLLEQVRETEMIGRDDLVRMLADQPIAALMVDASFSEEPLRGVPLLISNSTFSHEAESVLNRLITERRAELYRLGSELSRSLSTATMVGAGFDALLDAADAAGHRPLVLQSPEGSVLASSRSIDQLHPPAGVECVRLADTSPARPVVVPASGSSSGWLSLVVNVAEQRRRGARGSILSIALTPGSSMETERLILTQTAGAVELMLRQASNGGVLVRDRSNRESLLADLLLGRLVSREAADARARLLGLETGATTRVALIASNRSGDVSAGVRALLAEDRNRAAAMISEREYAVILIGDGRLARDWAEITTVHRSLRTSDDSLILALSDPVEGPAHAGRALAQARLLVQLARAGAIDGQVVRAGDVDQVGFFSLFAGLPGGVASDGDGLQMRLDAFASPLLSALEEHDELRGSDLIRTLDAYLRLRGALAQAADQLSIHRNTLSYRLGRIAELTGRDLNDPRSRFLLQVALHARALQRALANQV
jgi:PucR family transcriptional regulator, purine catabolism regulatory protein